MISFQMNRRKRKKRKNFHNASKNCHAPGSDFTIEFFSILVLRKEGRQGTLILRRQRAEE